MLTTTYSTPGPHPSVRPVRVSGTPLFDWKGIVHCHGRLSHDSSGTLEEISEAAAAAAVDFVVMTDHQTGASIAEGTRGFANGILFLVGAEVRTPQGTLLCFPLTRPLRRWQHAALLAREAEGQGALAFVCHGELWRTDWSLPGLAGAEIVNLHAGAMQRGYLGTLLTVLFLPMRYVCERICMRNARVFEEWDRRLARRHPFTPIGGNDAHANVRVFGPLGGTIGTYREMFLTLSTHALAEHLDEQSLVAAFAAGRTYVAFDVFGEGAGFDFRVVDAAGAVHLGGADVPSSPGLRLAVTTPAAGHIVLRCDGHEVRQVNGARLELTDPPPGLYRVEVCTTSGAPWLFSSTIRVR